MKVFITFIATIIFSSVYSQSLEFNNKGEARYILTKNGKSASKLFYEVHNYYKQAYLKNYPYLEVDSISEKIKVSDIINDVLFRSKYSYRKPSVVSHYEMEITFEDSKVIFFIKHLKFTSNGLDQYISFSNLIDEVEDPSIYPDEKKYFIDNYLGLINMFDYYIDNQIVKMQTAQNLVIKPYWDNTLKFDDFGNAETIIKFDGLSQENIYDRACAFAVKYFFKNKIDYDKEAHSIEVESAIYDVFNYRVYIPRRIIIGTKYKLKMTVKGNELWINVNHLEFRLNAQTYNEVLLKQILHPQDTLMIENKENFYKSYNKIISATKYYIDNLEMAF